MAPDGTSSILNAAPAPAEVPQPFAHDRIEDLNARITLLEAQSEIVARDFVRLHGLSIAAAGAQGDLLQRIDRLVRMLEADVVRVHGLLGDARSTLQQAESLWAQAVIGALPA